MRSFAGIIRTGRRAVLLLLAAVLFCAALGPSAADQSDSTEPPPDPVPLRRVLLSPDRLAAELERARRGVLVRVPRDDFEAQLKRATEAGEALKTPPRLIESRYRATLTDTGALQGNAEWKIINPVAVPGLLPVQPFNLALRQARWPDNRNALLGELDGKELALLVDSPGERSLFLEWSARSTPVPGGMRFSLEVPACAVASLELDVPADRTVTASRDSTFVTGPHPAAAEDRRTWRVGFAGRTQINVVVRRGSGLETPPPLVLSHLQTRQDVTPGQVQADYDFDLEVLHGAVRELRFAVSPSLRPYEVTVRNLEGWELRPGPFGLGPATLVIRLREPFQAGALQVRCLAPFQSNRTWVSPGLDLLGAVSQGESLVLRIHPDVQLEEWRPAGFRVTRTTFQQDGWQVLTLGAGLDAGHDPERPSARLQTPGPEYRTRQLTWWQVAPEQSSLGAEITYEVTRGRLFRLPLLLPPGWEVERVELTPVELFRHWSVAVEKGRPVLIVELQGGLAPGTHARLSVAARPRQGQPVPAAGLKLPLPDIVPLDARSRDGALAVSIAPLYQASVTASVPAVPPETVADSEPIADLKSRPTGPPRPRIPWGKQLPEFCFAFRGQAIDGTLHLRPRPPRFSARCTSDVVLASGRAVSLVRLQLHPEVGAPRSVDLFTSGPDFGRWDWQTVRGGNQVVQADRLTAREAAPLLSALAARHPLQALTLALVRPPLGTWWRLTLARPLTEPLTLEAKVELSGRALIASPPACVAPLAGGHPLAATTLAMATARSAEHGSGERRWDVPLVSLPAADRLDGLVTLHLAGTDLVQVRSTGLEEVSEAARRDDVAHGLRPLAPASSSWRTFRYGTPPMTLVLRGRAPASDRSAEAVIDRAWLTTHLEPDGRLLHHCRFQVWNWRQHTVPLRLPADARLLAAKADGRWLDRLSGANAEEGMRLFELPVAGLGPLHRFEVLYATEPRYSWRLQGPAPQLPVEPLTFRRTWRLPPGVVPLHSGSLQRLPGGSNEPDGLQALTARAGTPEERAGRQEQLLTDAAVKLRKQYRGQQLTLGQLLESLAFDHLKDQAPLVLDMQAVRQAQLRRATPVAIPEQSSRAAPPWETVGLVHVPCDAGVLLTTREQRAVWRSGMPSRSVEDGVAQAVQFGHDASGRFRTVADWLRDSDGAGSNLLPVAGIVAPSVGADGSEWEAVAGQADADTLLVVRPATLPAVGVLIAVLLALIVGWLSWRGRELLVRRLLLAWLLLAALALLWLPPPVRALAWAPALVGVVLAGIGCLLTARSRAATSAAVALPIAPPAGAALALLVAATLTGEAAAPAPVTVYLVPESGNEKAAVLAPPELLEHLQTLARRGVPGLRGAVLLGAAYQGKVEKQSVQFEATFPVHCFSEEPATLTLPLTGIQLTEALLDGAAAQPVALKAPKEGYTLAVKGRGSHSVVLRFTVPLAGTGDDRDLRFGIPELPQSKLLLNVPAGAGYLQALDARGGQRTTAADKVLHLDSDLGSVGTVRVRWRRDGGQSQPATVSVKESYYWDLRASSARLLAILQYTVLKGSETTFQLDLPRDIEVHSVETGAVAGGAPPPRLKEWLLKEEAGRRRLRLEFQAPVSGSVQVTLELVPRRPFGASANLPFPTPLDAQAADGFLAYHLEGIDAGVTNHHAITGIQRTMLPGTFTQWFGNSWKTARQEDLALPTRAYWRSKGGLLQLALKRPATQVGCSQDVTWRVEQRQAAVRASARVTAPDNSLSFIEWDVPAALAVTEVSGPQVRFWTRAGGRLQIWLQRPAAEATLQLTGWLPRLPRETARFVVPALPIDGRTQSHTVRIVAGEGLTLRPNTLQNLKPQLDQGVPGREWVYTSDQENYAATFLTSSATANTDFRVLTFAEVRNHQLTFVATVEGVIRQGELRGLTVSLRNWEAGEVTLNAPNVARQRPQRLGGTGRAWALDLQPGVKQRYRLTLSGTMPLGAAEVLMPDVRVESAGGGAARQERLLAVAGQELQPEGDSGLAAVRDGAAALKDWPGDAERLRRAGGSAWKVIADDWRLRLRPRPPAARAASVQVFLTEQAAAVGDGRRWLHQATYWLYHEAGADLSVVLPPGATVLAVGIDGVSVPPLEPGSERLWLPLPGGAGSRTVRLSWAFPPGRETITRPLLAAPRLEGVADSPVVWTVHVPAGYQVVPARTATAETAEEASAAALELWRADAQLRLLTYLLERSRDGGAKPLAAQVAEAQAQFERRCHKAEQQLMVTPSAAGGPAGKGLAAWLQELREQHRQLVQANQLPADPSGGESAKAESSQGPTTGAPLALSLSFFERGRPVYWQGGDAAVGPPLKLTAVENSRSRQALGLTSLVLVLVIALWILGHFFKTAAWPEQLAVLGCLGALLFGPGVASLFWLLPVVVAGGRLIWLAGRGRDWWEVRPPQALPVSEGSPPAGGAG